MWVILCGYIPERIVILLAMVNNEIELIRTVDMEKKDVLVRRLVNAGISYLEKWERIPFFKRHEYDGAKEICVIFINDNQKELAFSILEKENIKES